MSSGAPRFFAGRGNGKTKRQKEKRKKKKEVVDARFDHIELGLGRLQPLPEEPAERASLFQFVDFGARRFHQFLELFESLSRQRSVLVRVVFSFLFFFGFSFRFGVRGILGRFTRARDRGWRRC